MRIIVGISGASGGILGLHMLRALAEQPGCETHLVMTEGAVQSIRYETDLDVQTFLDAADYAHPIDNLGALIASGSYKTDGLIIIPCSMKTLAGVVNGYSDNLLLRAADVCLKEQRKVILVPREMPLSAIHLDNMRKAVGYGCAICPPMLTFYNKPQSIDDMINHIIGKVILLLGLEPKVFAPWKGGA